MTYKRDNLQKHFTASALVIEDGHVLLIHHRRIGAWLPPGGHIDEFELPSEAAVREVFEETGIVVEIISKAMPETGDPHAFFLPEPLCIHCVKATEGGVDLEHIDIVYLCRPVYKSPLPPIVVSDEVKDARWVHLSDIANFLLAKNVKEALALAQSKEPSFLSVPD